MKKMNHTLLILVLLFTCGTAMAQGQWLTDLNSFDPRGDIPRLGTQNEVPLHFYTNNTKRMALDLDGNLLLESNLIIKGLSNDDATAAPAVLMVDPNGVLTTISRQPGGDPACKPGALSWVMGGNNAVPTSPIRDNVIGTCNDADFVLKANDVPMLFMKSSSVTNTIGSTVLGIGPGNSSPEAQLDVTSGLLAPYPTRPAPDHLRIYGDYEGHIESTGQMNLLCQDGFAISTGLLAVNTSAKFIMTNSGKTHIVDNLQLGFNGASGMQDNAFRLNVEAAGSVNGIKLTTNKTSGHLFYTSNSNYGVSPFQVAVDGRTSIGTQGGSSNTALLNLNLGTGDAIDVSDGTNVNFRVKSSGLVFAREIEVMTATFPDYVFSAAYQLKPLAEVESFIKQHKHLPGFEAGTYYEEHGIKTAEMFVKQQEKIEELTLYIIELEKRLSAIENKTK